MELKETNGQILITGCYRSGTEYVTQLLNNHPKLSATMYTVSFMRFCYDRFNPIDKKENYTRLISEAEQRIKQRWGKNLYGDRIIEYCNKVGSVTYALLYDLMMADLFLTENVRRWAEKTQLVWTKIPAFLAMYPDGKAINIIRDPRSVLASFKKVTYAPKPAYLGAVFNCCSSMQLSIQYQQEFGDSRFLLVKYEDIIHNPESMVRRMFDFLGLSSDHDLISDKGWRNARGQPWIHNSAFHNKEKKQDVFDKQAALQRWKKHLDDWEIAFCEMINEDLMKHFGYELSGIQGDWETYLKHILVDEKITRYLHKWLTTGEGVEEFPTDPLKPENWAENR